MLHRLLLLVCCLTFKFIECSRIPQLPTSLSNPIDDDDDEQTKSLKTGKLVPKGLFSKTEKLQHSDWTYYPFPTSTTFEGHQFASFDTIHSHNDVQIFACIGEGLFGTSNLRFKGPAPGTYTSCNLDKRLTSVSIYEKNILVTSEGHFKRIEKAALIRIAFPWYP